MLLASSRQALLHVLLAVIAILPFAAAHYPEHERSEPELSARAANSWQQEAQAKNQRTNDKIPSSWLLNPKILSQARQQQRLIGTKNNGKDIDDFILTLPQANFSNPYIVGTMSSANKTIAITNTDPVDLVAAMQQKKYTAVDVVTAFCLRSAIIHQIHPVLLDVAFAEAIQSAKDLDGSFNKTGKLKGGLHGLPVTFKDIFHATHMETSGSYVGWFAPPSVPSPPRTQAQYRYQTIHPTNFQNNPKTFDSDVTQLLKAQGAIPIAKTTVMQTTWEVDTENNYIGFLTNPYNFNLSAGGSSGGEGVLQALGGAAFGIGEDSGGSVSMPSSLHGLYSLKPSSGFYFATSDNGTQELLPIAGRMSTGGAVNFGTRLQCAEITAPGIMTRSIRAVKYIYENTVTQSGPAPAKSNFTFAYLNNDGAFTPHPPIQRAMNMVETALKQAGATLGKWTGTASSVVSSVQGNLARADNIVDAVYYKNVTGEDWAPVLEVPPGYNPGPWDASEQQALDAAVKLRDQYRAEYNKLFDAGKIDALIMPTFASTDWPKGGSDSVVLYSTWANVLNVPSVTMFVTYASKDLDKKPTNFKGFGQDDVAHMNLYDPEATDGTPISIMVMGRLNGEAELLAAVDYIQAALAKH